MHRCVLSAAFFVFAGVAALAEPVGQQWLTSSNAFTSGRLSDVPILEVSGDYRQEAIDLLQRDQAVELSEKQAKHFLGANKNMPVRANMTAKPFLVRGVNPTGSEGVKCRADLYVENRLYVFCGGLGEYRYKGWPLIVFLDHKPAEVGVGALTAM